MSYSKVTLVAIFILAGFSLQKVHADDCFVIGPYVVHADHSSAKIVWVTPPGTDPGLVEIEPADGGEQQDLPAAVSEPRFHDNNLGDPGERDDLRQLVQLENLEPYTRYDYTAQCGDGMSSRTGTFRTAPEPGEAEPFEFSVVADAHACRRDFSPVADLVGEYAPDIVFDNGDLAGGYGADWHRWLPYFELARPYHEKSILVPTNGSHDLRPNRNFRTLFAFNDPKGDPEDEDEAPSYHSMTYGNVEFFMLDHDYSTSSQLDWLGQKLEESNADWKVVVMHRFRANIGSRGRFFTSDYYDFGQLNEEHGVDLVLHGHDHMYERRLPIGSEGVKPVHYITTNANGHFRTIRPSPIVKGGIGQHEKMFAHFHVDGNHLQMKAVNQEGEIIDSLELIKDEAGMYQQEIMDQAVDLDLARKLAHIYTSQSMAEDLTEKRQDLTGSFVATPEDDRSVILRLDTGYSGTDETDVSRFPIGSELIVYEQDDPSDWRAEKQVIEITGDYADVKLIAPEDVSWSEDGPDPGIELDVNIRVDGREFERATIRPGFEEELGIGEVILIHPEQTLVPVTLSNPPYFEWEELDLASAYQLQIGSPNLATDNRMLDTVITETVFHYPEELDPDEIHRMRVRGLGEPLIPGTDPIEGPWIIQAFYPEEGATTVEAEGEIPAEFKLTGNYPNPFNPVTQIRYSLPVKAHVTLKVYDALGRIVEVLINKKEQQPAHYEVEFASAGISSGVYLYRLQASPVAGLGSGHRYFDETRLMTVVQ